MLGFDLHVTRDAIVLSCTSCGAVQEVDRACGAEVVAESTAQFCDRHVPCPHAAAALAVPRPRRPVLDDAGTDAANDAATDDGTAGS